MGPNFRVLWADKVLVSLLVQKGNAQWDPGLWGSGYRQCSCFKHMTFKRSFYNEYTQMTVLKELQKGLPLLLKSINKPLRANLQAVVSAKIFSPYLTKIFSSFASVEMVSGASGNSISDQKYSIRTVICHGLWRRSAASSRPTWGYLQQDPVSKNPQKNSKKEAKQIKSWVALYYFFWNYQKCFFIMHTFFLIHCAS